MLKLLARKVDAPPVELWRPARIYVPALNVKFPLPGPCVLI